MTRPLRVVVSLGTDFHPFERLVTWLESWLAEAADGTSLYVQHGTSRLPRGAEGCELLSQPELRALMAEADVVILQGGPGGIIDSLVSGRRPVVVPRVGDLGEHVDNHQVAFARHFAAEGHVDVAEDETTLRSLLDISAADPDSRRITPYVVHSADTALRLGSLVDDLVKSRHR